MRYCLVQMVDGRLLRTDLTDDNLVPAMEVRGFQVTGFNANPRQRAELQGAPIFSDVCGPMWDGDGIRYEDPRAYAALST